jgi:hypothetical protein
MLQADSQVNVPARTARDSRALNEARREWSVGPLALSGCW